MAVSSRSPFLRACLFFLLLLAGPVRADIGVYDDTLLGGWLDWSWGGVTRNFASNDPVRTGTKAISVTYTEGWSGLKFSGFSKADVTGHDTLRFWVHGGTTGGQKVQVLLGDGSAGTQASVTFFPVAGEWTQIEVPLFSLGTPALVSYIQWFNATPGSQPTFYLDDVSFVSLGVPTPTPTMVPDGVSVYRDTLQNGWNDWSWGGVTRDLEESGIVQEGSSAVAVTFTEGWSGFKLARSSSLEVGGVDLFRFHVHGGTSGGQTIQLRLGDSNSGTEVVLSVHPVAGSWTRIDVPLAELGSPVRVSFLQWHNPTAGSQPTFYLDEMFFLASGLPTPTPRPPAPGPELRIDASADRHPISPWIYGMNFGSEELAAELRIPVRRWGGNATSRYNWRHDTTNRASDWYFENIPNDNPNPSRLPEGSASDRFIEQDRRTGTETFLTIPMIGWTAKSRARSCGFRVSVYGPQQSTDPWAPDCGNGIHPSGERMTGNDPADTSIPAPPSFVQEWIAHLISRFGSASSGGVRLYNLDNEPDLWSETHRDVHPTPAGYDELRDRAVAYAAAIKESDPGALTFGPASWGWTAYFWSSLDWAAGGSWWLNPVDRLAHGNVPFLDWYLQEMAAAERQHGKRLLDYLDVHYYPAPRGVALAGAGGSATQALRLRSTRSLWDPSYVDESWIGQPVRLIPRLREWVDTHYPGTGIAIGEYNWGALHHINGALAQADVLGIFGRERLDLATIWDPPAPSEPGAYAFRLYLNYDGEGGRFGDIGVRATSTDPGLLSVFAAENSASGALTVIVVNKETRPLVADIGLAGFSPASSAAVYRYSEANLGAIVAEVPQAVSPSGFEATLPASSLSLFVIPASNAGPTPTPAPCGNGELEIGEQCDDGNRVAGDGCDHECRRELIPGDMSSFGSRGRTDCFLEWSVINPGNSPAMTRRGLRHPVQSCRDNDPTCDHDSDPAARACEFEVSLCLNNVDPALPGCIPPGVPAPPRIQRPSARREPVLTATLATALTQLRNPESGEVGNLLPLAAGTTGICSEPFRVRVARPKSPRLSGRLSIVTVATGPGGTPRDLDRLTLVCRP